MDSFLLPSFATDSGPGFQLCGNDGQPDPKGNVICSPAPGSKEWMKWFQNRPGTEAMDAGSFAADFDEVFSFKSLKLWWAATGPAGQKLPMLMRAPVQGPRFVDLVQEGFDCLLRVDTLAARLGRRARSPVMRHHGVVPEPLRGQAMLQVKDLHKSYPTPQGALPVLQGADLRLERGDSLALMGESGSGKSTLLHLIAGLDTPDSGRIQADGQALHAMGERELAQWRRCSIGLIFQQYNLVGSLNVADNLAFQARLAGRHDPQWQVELVQRLGLGDVLSRYPEQLSGGQQQRVALGRALASRPTLVLADEPTGNLDEATAAQVLDLLLALVEGSGSTLLMVTHSPQVAARLGRTVVLHGGRVHAEASR